mgnify:CR=1 FL=1
MIIVDEEYNVRSLTVQDVDLILDALSYVHWNDRSLSSSDRDCISNIYQNFNNTKSSVEGGRIPCLTPSQFLYHCNSSVSLVQ